ncbi:hypothetical protein ERJ75_001582400 [Trypanosoma vivax]|uniref:Uncharacterized protein n=1 Tax=Trypanosoma vivax (strain Y486) TaxID=1055687 RepID=F9WQA6_TRYVY
MKCVNETLLWSPGRITEQQDKSRALLKSMLADSDRLEQLLKSPSGPLLDQEFLKRVKSKFDELKRYQELFDGLGERVGVIKNGTRVGRRVVDKIEAANLIAGLILSVGDGNRGYCVGDGNSTRIHRANISDCTHIDKAVLKTPLRCPELNLPTEVPRPGAIKAANRGFRSEYRPITCAFSHYGVRLRVGYYPDHSGSRDINVSWSDNSVAIPYGDIEEYTKVNDAVTHANSVFDRIRSLAEEVSEIRKQVGGSATLSLGWPLMFLLATPSSLWSATGPH